jgi:hypothetical protein
LAKIVEAGSQLKSFALSAKMLDRLAEISISDRHVARLIHLVGAELAAARDAQTQAWLKNKPVVQVAETPAAVCICVDGGRMMTRTPTTGQGPGVFAHGWREDKVACLHKLEGKTFTADPQPTPPKCFHDSAYVDKLVREVKAHKGLTEVEKGGFAGNERCSLSVAEVSDDEADDRSLPWPPKRVFRTCVATQQDSGSFGPMVAAEAHRRRFFAASQRAFLGDGQACNWTIQRRWFPDFEGIADFIHVLSYLYIAATALAANQHERWQLYVTWMTACWLGKVADVIAELKLRREPLGPIHADEEPPDSDPRVVVDRAITYLTNNQSRMNYPAYRQKGLPVTSAAVESLIKEFNYRVKGSEKFWNDPAGAESILQTRAAVLSDDDRLNRHVRARPGSPFRKPPRPREDTPLAQAA